MRVLAWSRRRRGLLAIACVLGLVGIVGVGLYDARWTVQGHSGVQVRGKNPQLLVDTGQGCGLQARVPFKLDYLPGPDCFVSVHGGGDIHPIIWPPGSRVRRDGDRLGVSVPKGTAPWDHFRRTTFWVGDEGVGGGGGIDRRNMPSLPRVPKQCHSPDDRFERYEILGPNPRHFRWSQ